MINKVKNINKKYIVLFLVFALVLITPFTYSKYTSKYTKHITISAIQSGYKVKFDSNGGEGLMGIQSFEYGTSQKLNKSLFTKKGYVFSNWNTDPNGIGTSYDDQQEVNNLTTENGKTITLYAIYVRQKFALNGDIKFDGQGGKNPFIDTGIRLFDAENIRRDFEISFEIKSREATGYLDTMMSVMDETGTPWPGIVYRVFNDSNDQLVINTVQYGDFHNEQYYSNGVSKVTIKRISDAIFLSLNDGESIQLLDTSSMVTPFDRTVVFGAGYDENGNPFRWFKGTLSNLKVVVNDRNNESGIIRYYPNGGKGNAFSQNVLPDSTDTLMQNIFVRNDYVFNGWNTKADGTGTQYNDDVVASTIVNVGQVKNLYAQWKEYKYSVVFDKNGGEGTMDPQEFNSGEVTNIKQSEFIKDGYNFAFWNTKADGSGVSYEDQEAVKNLGIEENQVITLYAMYEKFEYNLPGEIIFDMTDRFEGKNYIDTHIYLFSRKNANKNFVISFNINSITEQKDFDTIVSSMDESGDPYAGFVFRINEIESEFKYQLEANSKNSRDFVKNYDLITPLKVVIKRENGILKMQLGENVEEVIIDYTTLTNNFYYPLTIGASVTNKALDGSNMEFDVWRNFRGVLSDLSITLDNTGFAESIEPTEGQ